MKLSTIIDQIDQIMKKENNTQDDYHCFSAVNIHIVGSIQIKEHLSPDCCKQNDFKDLTNFTFPKSLSPD
jgi:hypothetical protein